MSDQRPTSAVISLEEIFTSREFGRRPARAGTPSVSAVEAIDPPLLEQVFLSELFGHPEALVTSPPRGAGPILPPAERPTLVLLPGRGDAERDLTRYRGAIGAVSGVAAAALVVAGITTSGTGSRSEQPTISAQGNPPGPNTSGGGGSFPGPGGVATQPGTTAPPPAATGGAGGGAPIAHFASATTPATAAVVVSVPAPAPAPAAPSPPAPGGGTPPPTPPGPSTGGGGSVLTPVFVTVGTTVSSLGSTVTAASNDLAHVVPAASPVTGLLANIGATVTSLGQSVAGA
jgi:hypothetical protein